MPDYTVRFTHLRHGLHVERVMAQEQAIATRAGWRFLGEWLKRRDITPVASLDGWEHVETVLTPPEDIET